MRRMGKAWGLLMPVALGIGLVTAPATSAGPAQDPPDGGRYLEPVFEEMDVTRDVPYREATDVNGDLVTLHLDIYEPAGDTAAERPVLMYMHGGYFAAGTKADTYGAEVNNVATGYVFVSVEYRLRPDAPSDPDELVAAVYDAYDDSVAALQWLRDNAAEYRIDPDAIVPIGPSAGGVMAWNLAWMPGSDERPEEAGVPAAVSVSGAPFRQSPDGGDVAAPDPGEPPVLAFHGTADSTVPFVTAERPCLEAADVGVLCELVAYEGGGHYVGLEQFDDIQRRTWDFLAEHVLGPQGYFGDDDPPPTTTTPSGTTPPPSSAPTTTPPPNTAPPGTTPPAPAVVGTPSLTG